jgi:hypothetical protein
MSTREEMEDESREKGDSVTTSSCTTEFQETHRLCQHPWIRVILWFSQTWLERSSKEKARMWVMTITFFPKEFTRDKEIPHSLHSSCDVMCVLWSNLLSTHRLLSFWSGKGCRRSRTVSKKENPNPPTDGGLRLTGSEHSTRTIASTSKFVRISKLWFFVVLSLERTPRIRELFCGRQRRECVC